MSGKRRVFSLGGRKLGSGSGERIVKYSTGVQEGDRDDDLEDIAIVSNADLGEVTYGGGGQGPNFFQTNGPRVVPGIITSGGSRVGGPPPPPASVTSVSERLSTREGNTVIGFGSPVLGGGASRPGKSGESSFNGLSSSEMSSIYAGSKAGPVAAASGVGLPRGSLASNAKSSSKQSLLDLVGNRLGVSGGLSLGGVSLGGRKRFSRESFSASAQANNNSGGGGGAGGGNAGGSGGSRNLAAGFNQACCSELDVTSKRPRDKRKEIRTKLKLDKWESSTASSEKTGCRWTFVFDPAGRLCYYWSMVVSLAFLYNFWVLIYRFAFQEINRQTLVVWFSLDYMADFLYLLDIGVHFRTGYLEDGVLQTDSTKLRHHYMNSTTFYIDCLCLLPLDFLYLSIDFTSILRCFRLVKIYRFWAFMDRTERHTNYPNIFRSISLVHYLLVIFHWNACLFHIIHKNDVFGAWDSKYKPRESDRHDSSSVVMHYLQSFYQSVLTLTTVGELPTPKFKGQFLYVIFQRLFGLMLFATVLGHVANIVTNVSAARKEFQAKLDGVKTYMRMRRVPNYLQVKVIKWFDYLWLTQKCSDEDKAVGCLPDKLKAEIAINVHLDTLRRVEIFQNTEAGFLCELVLRLRPVLFSPGDYICRKGEVGKEMYIVNRGRLQVVADDGKTVLATLKPGSYFGEISILNMGTAGNRRTASVRSVGYSDLFVLSKTDMWDVLKEYPAARVRLEAIAVRRLEKYKKAPLEKAAMGRSNSTPGLVESAGKVPLEDMWVSPVEPVKLPGHSATSNSSIPSSEEDKSKNMASQPKLSGLYPSGAGSMASSSHDESGDAFRRPSVSPSTSTIISAANFLLPSSTMSYRNPSTGVFYGIPPAPAPYHLEVPASADHHQQQQHPQQHQLYETSASPCSSDRSIFCHHRSHGIHRLAGGAHPPTTLALGQDIPPDALLQEIRRLRERLVTLETENATLSLKLSQQQWEVEHRLAEIEMHICGASSAASSGDEERNRESAI